MHILKKLLILVIVFTTIFIIYNLLKTRNTLKLQALQELEKKRVEGFGEDEIQKITESNDPVAISAVSDKFLELPLREFIVKSSYNSAISGVYANQEMIRILLQRGVRLLDFEIYTDNNNNIEYISYSKDGDLTMSTENAPSDRVSFANAMSTVNAYSFVMPTPSPNDPLFLSLRVKNDLKDAKLKAVYKRIADILKTSFPSRLYQDSAGKAIEVNGSTPFKDIMGKIVVIFDTERQMQNYNSLCKKPEEPCSEIYPFVNIAANISGGLPIYHYNDITTKMFNPVLPEKDGYGTNINTFFMVMPPVDDVIDIPPPRDVINSSFPQFMLYKFYIKNTNLAEYENIFNNANSSFVPMSSYLSTSQSVDADNDQVIKPSIPQKPAGPLGFSFKLW
jgi:hypothetical protein